MWHPPTHTHNQAEAAYGATDAEAGTGAEAETAPCTFCIEHFVAGDPAMQVRTRVVQAHRAVMTDIG